MIDNNSHDLVQMIRTSVAEGDIEAALVLLGAGNGFDILDGFALEDRQLILNAGLIEAVCRFDKTAAFTFLQLGAEANLTLDGLPVETEDAESIPGLMQRSLLHHAIVEQVLPNDIDGSPEVRQALAALLIGYGAKTALISEQQMIDITSLAVIKGNWQAASALCALGVMPVAYFIDLILLRRVLPESGNLAQILAALETVLGDLEKTVPHLARRMTNLQAQLGLLSGRMKAFRNSRKYDDLNEMLDHIDSLCNALLAPPPEPLSLEIQAMCKLIEEGRAHSLFTTAGSLQSHMILKITCLSPLAPSLPEFCAWRLLLTELSSDETGLAEILTQIWKRSFPTERLTE